MRDFRAAGRRRRRGAVMILAATTLFISVAIALTLVRSSYSEIDNLRRSLQQQQAVELTNSGVARAIARLTADRSYRGEIWTVPAAELDGLRAGIVKIEVIPATSTP